MSILGQLLVELKANTASFIEGMTGAGKTARTVGREIEGSLSGLGSAVTSALGPLGEIGPLIGESLGRLGEVIGTTTAQFAKLGASSTFVVGAGAAAGAALLATEAGAIGLAIHTAMATAELGELSQKTGVSTQTLAALGVSARETGVPMEGLAKALALMNNNAVKASIAPATTKTAFQRLGVDVTDTTGKMRDSAAVFTDVMKKIATLPQPEQGYFAKQIFGKGGAEILPLLNLGVDKLAANASLATTLGLGDPQAVAASLKFKETVADIRTEFDGIALNLTKDLLPAMQFIAERVKEAFATGEAQHFLDVLASITKGTIAVGDTFVAIFLQAKANWSLTIDLIAAPFKIGIALVKDFYDAIKNIASPIAAVFSSIFSGVGRQVGTFLSPIISFVESVFRTIVSSIGSAFEFLGGKLVATINAVAKFLHLDTLTDAFKKWGSDTAKIWADNSAFINGVFAPQQNLPLPTPGNQHADLGGKEKTDTTLDRIKERIAALQQETIDWAKVASAGTQAEQLIAEAIKKGNEEFGKLKAEAARDKTGAALPVVLKNEDLIKSAGAESIFGSAIKSLTGDLDKEKLKLDEQSKAALELAQAYQQGGAAIANAAIGQKFAEQGAKLQVLVEAHTLAVAQWGKDSQIATQLADAIAKLTSALQNNEDIARKVASDELTAELSKQSAQFQALKPFVDAVSGAYLVGEDAVRKARIELELYRFEEEQLAKGIVLTAAQKEQERKIIEDADRQAYDGALLQQAAHYSLAAQYDNEIVKLERLREVLQQNGQSTLLIDSQLQQAQDNLIHQWDEAAFKVGTFKEKFQGAMGELVIQGRAAGAAISQAFVSAIDGIETNLAKLLTGQKTNFKAVAQGLAESVTKSEIQKGVGALASRFGLNIPGLAGKPDGSSESLALWVKLVAGPGLGPASVPFGAGNIIPGFGIGSDGSAPPGSMSAGSAGGGFNFGSMLSSLFGGGFADGGYLGPGRWGIAGERGPEPIFGGRGGVSVMPNSSMRGASNNFTFNYNHSSDRDLFNRTDRQNAARHIRNLKSARA